MRRVENIKNLAGTLIVAALACAVPQAAAQDESELLPQLRACRAIADDALRLVCYDMLGKVQAQISEPVADIDSPPQPVTAEPVGNPGEALSDSTASIDNSAGVASAAAATSVAASSTPAPVAAQVATPEPEYAPLTDDIGAWGVRSANEAKRPIRAKVTRCFQNARDDYFFGFENGQIWKYKGSRRLRYKECNFHVTIMRDGFGYKMQPEGEERTLRISRVD